MTWVIGCEVHPGVHRASRPCLIEGGGDRLGADPTVAVPLGATVPKPDAVQHAGPYKQW